MEKRCHGRGACNAGSFVHHEQAPSAALCGLLLAFFHGTSHFKLHLVGNQIFHLHHAAVATFQSRILQMVVLCGVLWVGATA
jgi:hypothetical protein